MSRPVLFNRRLILGPVFRTSCARFLEQSERIGRLAVNHRVLAEIERRRAALIALHARVDLCRSGTQLRRRELAEEILADRCRPRCRVGSCQLRRELVGVVLADALAGDMDPEDVEFIRGVELQPALQVGGRVGELAEVELGPPPVLECLGVVRIEGDRAVEVQDCVGIVAL